MKVERTTYVAADYRHLTSDLVVTIPLRRRGRRDTVTLYILIEHQSEPDALMILRVLEYLVQIYRAQLRDWEQQHGSRAGFRLQPVLAVVLYTGTGAWESLGRLSDLVEGGELFPEATPEFRPLFVSLPATAVGRSGVGGRRFRLGAGTDPAAARTAGGVRGSGCPCRASSGGIAGQRALRWLELLSYVLAIIYHDRLAPEREGLKDLVVASVRTDERRREVEAMVRTGADVLREEGRKEGRREGAVAMQRQALLRSVPRFKKVPKAIERTIDATDDTVLLGEWLERTATASTVDKVGFGGES